MSFSFWLLVVIQGINALGDGFGAIGLGWLVYEITGSKLAMGGLIAAGMAAETAVRLLGSPLVDRINRFRLMTVIDAVQCVAYLAPVMLWMTDLGGVRSLFVLSVVAGAARALYMPSFLSAVPALVDRSALHRANAVTNMVLHGMGMISPVAAGLVVATWGGLAALTADSITFGLSSLALWALSRRYGHVSGAARRAGGYMKQILEGFAFFGRVPALAILMAMIALCNFGIQSMIGLTVPFVREVLGGDARVLGIVAGAFPMGFLLGAIAAGFVGEVQRRRPFLLGLILFGGSCLMGLSLVGPGQTVLAVLLMAGLGVGAGLFTTTSNLIFQTLVPDWLRGRVMVVRVLIAFGAAPLGVMAGSALAESHGFSLAFFTIGLGPVLLGIFGWLVNALRQFDGELKPVEVLAS